MVQVEMPFMEKDISYLGLWQPLLLVEQNHICNFGRRYHAEQFCDVIFLSGPVVLENM